MLHKMGVFVGLMLILVGLSGQRDTGRLREETYIEDNRIVRLVHDGSLCSGFIVAKNTIATAAHCVMFAKKQNKRIVEFIDGPPVTYTILSNGGVAYGQDWALLNADTGDRGSMKFSIVAPEPYTMVAMAGHPHGIEAITMSYGMILVSGEMLIIAGVNYPGESGSPIVSKRGGVVGILSAVARQAPVTYGTPIKHAARSLFAKGRVQ